MKLAEQTLIEFNALLGSEAPAPGGGSTAALEGALGAALIRMVGALTAGKAKFAEHQDLISQMITEADKISRRLIEVIDLDTEAFNSVTAVFDMPKNSDQDKAARKAAMQEALKACTKTPHQMMALSLAALELAAKAVGKINPNTASDFGVAALSLKAAVQGAWLNILINISGLEDQAFAAHYREAGEAILAKALPLADELYEGVLKSLA